MVLEMELTALIGSRSSSENRSVYGLIDLGGGPKRWAILAYSVRVGGIEVASAAVG